MKTFKVERINLTNNKKQVVIKTGKQLTPWDKKVFSEGRHIIDGGYNYCVTKII